MNLDTSDKPIGMYGAAMRQVLDGLNLQRRTPNKPVQSVVRCLSCGAVVQELPNPGQGLPCGH